jgi:hypothetical protein
MIGTRTRGQQQWGQGDSNGNNEDDDDNPSTTPMRMTMTQCHHHRQHQLLYLKEPTIAGLPRCRSCCIWETVVRTSHCGDKRTAMGTMRTRTMTTQCCRCQQFLYSKEPAIVGLPRCRSCCIWETAACTSHRGDKGTTTRMMRMRTMTPAPP